MWPRKRRATANGSPHEVSTFWNDVLPNAVSHSRESNEMEARHHEQSEHGHICEHHIPSILTRLANAEQQLQSLKLASTSTQGAFDIASMRSILAPAMQGHTNTPSYRQLFSSNTTTPIYDDREHQSGDGMDALSLRRNLSRLENPPFGMWWTFTIEETLVWPILAYQGRIDDGLDAAMEQSDEEGGNGRSLRNSAAEQSSLGKIQGGAAYRNGLDDGNTVRELVECFLRNVYTRNLILDPAQLRAYAASLIEDGLKWNEETCQVLLACALGAISYAWNPTELADYSGPKTTPNRYLMAEAYFSAAQKRLGSLWTQSSLISAQCLFMTGTFFMYTQKPIAGWRMFNSASIACRSYISKRMAIENRGMAVKDSRSLEQRLCWSCFKAERELACEFGMETSGLNQIAYSTSLPSPPNDYASGLNQLSVTDQSSIADSSVSPKSFQYHEDRPWYYHLTEIILRKLEMRIDIFFQDKRREAYARAGTSPELFFQSLVYALQEFDYQLKCYHEALPPVMHFPLDDLTPCVDELRHYLRWRFFSVRHDISLPALYILLHNDISGWSRTLIADLVQLANTCLRLDIIFLNIAVTSHRHHTTWLGPRKGVRSALTLIAAQRLAAQQRPELKELYVPDNDVWKLGVQVLTQGLQYWASESKDCTVYLDMLRILHPDFLGHNVDDG